MWLKLLFSCDCVRAASELVRAGNALTMGTEGTPQGKAAWPEQ